jgi:hypothetical protein
MPDRLVSFSGSASRATWPLRLSAPKTRYTPALYAITPKPQSPANKPCRVWR